MLRGKISKLNKEAKLGSLKANWSRQIHPQRLRQFSKDSKVRTPIQLDGIFILSIVCLLKRICVF